jgi:hypothetical protein
MPEYATSFSVSSPVRAMGVTQQLLRFVLCGPAQRRVGRRQVRLSWQKWMEAGFNRRSLSSD